MNTALLQAMTDRALVSNTLLDPADVAAALRPAAWPELHAFLCDVYEVPRLHVPGFDPMAA